MEKIVLIGAGGHAKTIVDSIERAKEFEIAGFIDNVENGQSVYRGYEIIGCDEDMERIYGMGIHNAMLAIGYIGNSDRRNEIYKKLKKIGFCFPIIIDPTAVVAGDAKIGEGTYIGRNAVVNVEAQIGKNCIINTSAVIEHECFVDDFTHVAVAAILCGRVNVGRNTLVGANSTILQNCSVGNNCIIGAGAVVNRDLPSDCIATGVPARIMGIQNK